ncbi:hypothetical protein BH10PSE10_BH10PSE10_00280 [soil metagenome]
MSNVKDLPRLTIVPSPLVGEGFTDPYSTFDGVRGISFLFDKPPHPAALRSANPSPKGGGKDTAPPVTPSRSESRRTS